MLDLAHDAMNAGFLTSEKGLQIADERRILRFCVMLKTSWNTQVIARSRDLVVSSRCWLDHKECHQRWNDLVYR